MYKITAGRGNSNVADFLEEGVVAIGWSEAGDYRGVPDRESMFDLFASSWPDWTTRQVQVGVGQVWRFLHEITEGAEVITYDPGTRNYHLGVVTGAPEYQPDFMDRLPVTRTVDWQDAVSRDALSQSARNSLGAILTLFKVPDEVAEEIRAKAEGRHPTKAHQSEPDDEADDLDPYVDIEDQAVERIKDRILSLSWDELQELVAALLRAMGYRTIVSAAGPDRGRDILASRDGFGFEPPRIVVEVKHRRGSMGAPEVRAFLGGRHQDDRGLYVSTGGFTREAHYEADRASLPTHLMDIDALARSLIEQYENLDNQGRSLLPLTKLYWPR